MGDAKRKLETEALEQIRHCFQFPLPFPPQLKKILHTPDFPSKRNPNLRQKPSHQRRQELKDYVQVPAPLITGGLGSQGRSLNDSHSEDYSCRLLHQRGGVGFCKDPYMLEESSDFLPNMIVDGVLQGLYPRDIRVSFTPCTKSWPPTKTEPAASPEASPS
ncbi:UNVERIFIED_CONTAM: hypothetical protein FKN15_006770 [Acipenser sinensis]